MRSSRNRIRDLLDRQNLVAQHLKHLQSFFLSQIKTFQFSCVTKNIVATPKLVSGFRYKAELDTTYCSTKWLTAQSLGQVTGFYEAGGFLEPKLPNATFILIWRVKWFQMLLFVCPNHVGSYCRAIVQLVKFQLPQSTKGSWKYMPGSVPDICIVKLNSIRRWNYSQTQTVTHCLILWDVIRASGVPTANCQSWPTFLHMRSLNRTGTRSRF